MQGGTNGRARGCPRCLTCWRDSRRTLTRKGKNLSCAQNQSETSLRGPWKRLSISTKPAGHLAKLETNKIRWRWRAVISTLRNAATNKTVKWPNLDHKSRQYHNCGEESKWNSNNFKLLKLEKMSLNVDENHISSENICNLQRASEKY